MKHQLLFVEDGIAIIRLRGELDHHATQLIREMAIFLTKNAFFLTENPQILTEILKPLTERPFTNKNT